ncbi:MAG TPA: hypothetical protein DD379_18340 [Cyanobacteria bacterium UBA11162]|nr:hypothetical protein [Cyanobacteria bacterium UBA11162]
MCPIAILFCIYLMVVTSLKPKFHWQSKQVRKIRCWLGDRGASIFYYGIGAGALALGLIVLGN